MARVKGNLNRGLSASRDFTRDPVEQPAQPATAQVDPRVAQARQRAGVGQGNIAPTLAAAAGAGFVFGPVGALLAGWAINQSQKANKKRLQAAATSLAQNKVDALDTARTSLETAYKNATTDQDRAEIKADLDAFESFATASFSPNPQTAEGAFAKALDISGTLQDLLDDQGDEIVARETAERAQLQRYQDQTVTLRNRLIGESKPFIESQRAYNVIDEMTSVDPTQIDSQILVNQLARLSNPGEIITEGDIAVLSTGGGLPDQLVNRLNSVLLGTSRLTPAVVAEVREASKSLMRNQVAEQVDRNQQYTDLARDLTIPTDLAANIQVPIKVDRARLPRSRIAESLYEVEGVDPTETPAQQFVERFVTGPLGEAFIPEGGLQAPPPGFLQEVIADPPWLIKAVMPDYARRAFNQGGTGNKERPTNGGGGGY